MNKFYVYALIDPRIGQPFYIGKGCGNRAYSHLKGKDHNNNIFKDRKISSIRDQGFEPYISFIKKNLSKQDALDLEESLILKYGRENRELDGILTNITLNGNPPDSTGRPGAWKGKKQPQEMIDKRAESLRGRKNSPHTEETKQKIREKRKLQVITEETKKKHSIRMSGDKNPFYNKKHLIETIKIIVEKGKETRAKRTTEQKEKYSKECSNRNKEKELYKYFLGKGAEANSKPVINLDTNEIYKSAAEAQRLTGINNIPGCCSGKPKTAGSYKWSYFDKVLYSLLDERFN